MSGSDGLHPTHDELTAYGLGKLHPPESVAIETHIAECEKCCETLHDLGNDTFVDLVRQSNALQFHSADDAGTIGLDEPGNKTVSDLPSELTNHPRYRVLELLGKGGMGNVYKAQHSLMNRAVAIKVINHELVQNAQAVERFRREVQSAAQLAHPNIVTAHDAEQAGDMHLLVMEYVQGDNLAEVVKRDGPLRVEQACDYIRQAALGLLHADENGMVHRDIKPHNLMVTSSGQVKILDFGLATLANESVISGLGNPMEKQDSSSNLTSAGAIMGTPDFISPEQASDARAADIRSDIYSLGCTLYYLLIGRPPFSEGSALERIKAHSEREVESIENVRDDVPSELAEILRHMMAKNPSDRFQTPAEIADALAPFVDAHRTTPTQNRMPDGANVDSRSRWPPTTLQSIGLTAFAFILAGIIYFTVEIIVRSATDATSQNNLAASALRRRRVWAGNEDNKGESYDPTTGGVSPDGRYFTGLKWSDGNLVIRDLTTGRQQYVTKGSGDLKEGYAYYSKPSPDGKQIAYTWSLGSEGKSQLRVIDVDGNRDTVLYHNPDGAFIYPRAWAKDGNTLVAFLMTDTTAGQIALFSVKDRTYRILKSLDWRWPATTDVSPDGDYIVYDAPLSQGSTDRDVFILPTDGRGPQVQLENPSFDSHPLWTPDGRGIVFVSDRGGSESLWYQQMNAGKPEGSPQLLVENVRFRNRRGRPLGFASNGAYYYVRIADPRLVGDIYSVELESHGRKVSGVPRRVIQLHQNANTLPGWSPNGRQLVYTSHRPGGSKLVVRDMEANEERVLQLTDVTGKNLPFRWWVAPQDYSPGWSPDGESILVAGMQGLHWIDVKSGHVTPLVNNDEYVSRFVGSEDGKSIYYLRTVFDESEKRRVTQIVARELPTLTETILHERQYDANEASIHSLAISPNWQELAFAIDDTISAIPVAGGSPRPLVKLADGERISKQAGIVWTSIGNRLIFGKTRREGYDSGESTDLGCELWSASNESGSTVKLNVPVDEIHQLCLHPDGKQITYCRKPRPEEQPGDEIWVIENFLPPVVESQ